MSYEVVKILSDDDGNVFEDAPWCLAIDEASTSRTLCTGQAFGIGDSRAEYEVKPGKKGSITCPDCRAQIKWFKSIQL